MTVNKDIISLLMDDKKSNAQIVDFLNQIIDNELESENPNCDLIDECVNTIDEIESTKCNGIRLVTTKKQVIKYCKRHTKNDNAIRGAIAACLVILLSGGVAFNTSPALAENAKSLFETIIATLINTDDEGNGNTVSIVASLPDGTNLTVKNADEIDLTNLKITAISSDGTRKEIDKAKCKIEKSTKHTTSGDYVIVAITYDGCSCTVAFELEE
jgi:hypothetical protein